MLSGDEMFKPSAAREEFLRFLKSRGLRVSTLSLRAGADAMLDFYRNVRAEGCSFRDSDMLLFQWGTYDWGEGAHFSINFTRQLILSEESEDEDIRQLGLTFAFAGIAETEALGSGTKWCASTANLKSFRDEIDRSGLLTLDDRLKPESVKLDYSCAG